VEVVAGWNYFQVEAGLESLVKVQIKGQVAQIRDPALEWIWHQQVLKINLK
jgi:hypothetical protein